MKKLKYLIFILFFIFANNSYSSSIQILVKVQDEIITNIDILNEKKYLIFLNPKLIELNNKKIYDIAKNSLITEIIKKKEIEKFNNLKNSENFIDLVENNFLKRKGISNKTEFLQILEQKELDYDTIRNKLYIETLWNQLIYSKFENNIIINEDYLKQSILNQYENNKKKFEYNLSEIFFTGNIEEKLDETLKKINSSIAEIGFENTANIFSISSTSKNGGLIGWVNELQISEIIKQNVINLDNKEISKPIKIAGGYLLIKLNNKREFKQEINLENQLKELISKEKNRQLNTFSILFYKRLKKNIQINEL